MEKEQKIILKYKEIIEYFSNVIKNSNDPELIEYAKINVKTFINSLYKYDKSEQHIYDKLLEEDRESKKDVEHNTKDTVINQSENVLKELKKSSYYNDNKIILNNGVEMPAVTFGTWRMWQENSQGYNPTLSAIECGCKAIDTAQVYGTEVGVGAAIKDSGVDRKEIFLTTKLDPDNVTDYTTAKIAFQTSLDNLQTDYVDIMYIHAPTNWDKTRKNDNNGIYRLIEEEYEKGRVKAIGLSNFNVEQLTELMKNVKIKPAVIQCSCSIGNKKYEDLISYCNANNIQILPYSPIASGYLLKSSILTKIAEAKGINTAELCLDYVGQKYGCFVFGSENPAHIKENIETRKVLTEDDMQKLDQINDDKTMWSYEESWKKNPVISSIYKNILRTFTK